MNIWNINCRKPNLKRNTINRNISNSFLISILSLITGSDLVTGSVLPCEGGMLMS